MKIIQVLAIIACASFIIGCDEEEDEEEAATGTVVAEGLSEEDAAAAEQAATSLVGAWSTGCIEGNDGEGGTVAERETMTYTTSGFELKNELQGNAGCEAFDIEFEATGTYTIGAAVEGIDDAQNLDLTIATFSVTLSGEMVTGLNQTSFCGFNDWEDGVAKDVTDQECIIGDEDTFTLPTNVGDKVYDVISIAENGETMLMGDDGGEGDRDGTTEEKRPDAIDQDVVWTKQ